MKKIFLLIFLVFSFTHASLKKFADGVIEVQEDSNVISTRDRTILFGGGYTLKTPNITLTPFAIKSPSLKSGCGGIDMVFGSLGFLNKEQFVKFAENIMAAAPGVAFDLALKTLCPSCSETLKALEAMANQINNMSLDSCQAATALGNTALDAIVGNNAKEELSKNNVDTFFEGINREYLKPATNSLQKENNWLSSLGAEINKPKIIQFIIQTDQSKIGDSLINYLIKDIDYINGLDFNILRTITGDITLGSIAAGDNSTVLKFLPGLYEDNIGNDGKIFTKNNTEKILNRLMGFGEDVPSTYNNSGSIQQNAFSKGELKDKYTGKVKGIVNKIVNRTSLSEEELNFLGHFNFPVYKIFNALGSNEYTQQVLQDSSENLAKMLSAQILYELLIKVNHLIQLQEGGLLSYKERMTTLAVTPKNEIQPFVHKMARDTREGARFAYIIYAKAYDDFISKLNMNQSIQKAKELKKLAIVRANPEMLSNLQFLETINK